MPTGSSAAARGVAIVMGVGALALAVPSGGSAARLVGGPTQRAIARAFDASRAHRRQTIVSIRTSSVSSSWAVVRSVTPQTGGRRASGAAPALHSTYYHRVGGRERPAPPPRAVRADLARAFRVQVVYTGSGGESITDQPTYRSVCPGAGGFIDTETVSVSPMSWSLRYVVSLDDLLGAVRGPDGVTLVPNVSFDAARSRVDAVENVSRTVQDVGCNARPATTTCTMTFAAGGPDPSGRLSFPPGSGLEVGLAMAPRPRGSCSPDSFTLGPSLWDSGGATALVGRLGLLGGSLPRNPYAPVPVSWPSGSAQQVQGFVASPCADAAGCTDTFQWHATVSLQSVQGG